MGEINLRSAIIASILFLLLVGLPMGLLTRNSVSRGAINSLICNIYEDDKTTYITLTNNRGNYKAIFTRKYNNISDRVQIDLSESDIAELMIRLNNLNIPDRNRELTLIPHGLTLVTKGNGSGDIHISLNKDNPKDLKIIENIKGILNNLTVGKCIKVDKSYNIDIIAYLIMYDKQNKIDNNTKNVDDKHENKNNILKILLEEIY